MSIFYRIIYNDKYRNAFFKLGELFLGAIIGLMIALPSDENSKILLSLIISAVILAICYFLFVLQENDPRKFDVLKFIRKSDYEVAISWAYTMRNLLSHAGYVRLKVDIAKAVYDLFDKYHIDNQRVIYDTGTKSGNIKATLLMDDFGWYSYEMDSLNAEKSITKIKEGIQLALEMQNNSLVCRGYRHLSNIIINQGISENENRDNTIQRLYSLKTEINALDNSETHNTIVCMDMYIDLYIDLFYDKYNDALLIADELLNASNNSENVAKANEAVGIIYYRKGEFSKAVNHFEIAFNSAKALRPGRYVSIMIHYFIAYKSLIDEQYTKYNHRLNKVGKREELERTKTLFEAAKDIAVSRDSAKLKKLVQSYSELKKVIKRN